MQQKEFSRNQAWLLEEKYQGKLTKNVRKDLARLKAGEPVDYVIGFVEFVGCKIDLSQKPLIPRTETEYWTEKAMQGLEQDKRKSICCLDIFSGSGCVGVAVLKNIAKAKVDFAEKEPKFLKQIRINTKLNSINPSRFKVFESDIFSKISKKYNYIFANPPYVATLRWKSVQPSVVKFEPKKALVAGKDGLKYIKEFLKQAKNHLALNDPLARFAETSARRAGEAGKIYLEFDSSQKQEIEKLLKKFRYSSWQFHKDQYKKWRFVVIT